MKMYRFPDMKIWKTLFCVYFFVMLLISRDTMIGREILTLHVSQSITCTLMLMLGIVFLTVKRMQLRDIVINLRMIAVVISSIVVLLPVIAKRDWQLMYFSILSCLFFAVLLSYFVSVTEIAKIYVVIISCLGVYSLLTNYGLKPLVEAGIVRVPTFVNSANRIYLNCLISFPCLTSDVYYRNFGVFREPGVYQFFVLLALLLNNYTVFWEKEWKQFAINVVLSVTMLSTFSTAGIIVLALFFCVVFLDKNPLSKKNVLIVILFISGVIIALAVFLMTGNNTSLYATIRKMVLKVFNLQGTRYRSIQVGVSFFAQSPIFGVKITRVLGAMVNNTSSTMLICSCLGIFGGLLHIAGWIALIWDKKRKAWVNLLLLAIMFMSFNTQNLIANVFFWLFPTMALLERGLPILEMKYKEMQREVKR